MSTKTPALLLASVPTPVHSVAVVEADVVAVVAVAVVAVAAPAAAAVLYVGKCSGRGM